MSRKTWSLIRSKRKELEKQDQGKLVMSWSLRNEPRYTATQTERIG
jgi:hypothetical protein